jgi:thiosulfate dehydrogenase (quinone) large subunit
MAVPDSKFSSDQPMIARSGSRSDRPEEQLGLRSRLSVGEFALFALRLALGLSFLQVAYKLFRGGWDGWTSASALLPGVVQGPIGNVYSALWGNQVVMWLIILGTLAIGLAMVAGFLTRLASLAGTLIMLSFYTACLPPTSGWFDVQLIAIFAFFALASVGAGHIWGIDRFLRRYENTWWYWMLG